MVCFRSLPLVVVQVLIAFTYTKWVQHRLLFAQHKPKLGRRRIKRIEAFAADTQASGTREPTLVWELEDIPPET